MLPLTLILAGCIESLLLHLPEEKDTGGEPKHTGDSPPFPDTEPDDTDPVDTGPEPEDCAPELRPASQVPAVQACMGAGPIAENPWEMRLEWYWGGFTPPIVAPRDDMLAAAIVSQITDDDGDGDVDADDMPDIVVQIAYDWSPWASLALLDGATGAVHWIHDLTATTSNPAVADGNGDGFIEIYTETEDQFPMALDRFGNTLWVAADPLGKGDTRILVADLWGDGTPEVIYDYRILDAATGDLVSELAAENPDFMGWIAPAVGDLDLDGEQEIIYGYEVFSPDGALEWRGVGPVNFQGHYGVIVQADADPGGEVAFVANTELAIYDSDGTPLVTAPIRAGANGAPAVADFDGDGQQEIVWGTQRNVEMWNMDGTRAWFSPADNFWSSPPCSGFDFNGDGQLEVVFADETHLWILNGRTGAILVEWTQHGSATLADYPVIADVDKDGSAEILLANNEVAFPGYKGLQVIGHPDSAWRSAGTHWAANGYSPEAYPDDGSVPLNPLSWQTDAVIRVEPVGDDFFSSDLTMLITDVCVGSCQLGRMKVALQAMNTGVEDVPAGVHWSLSGTVDGANAYLAQGTLEEVPAETASAGFIVELGPDALRATSLTIEVDDLQTVVECNETNNVQTREMPPCE